MTAATTELDYTQRMNADIRWALREGGLFFYGEGEVHISLKRITARLNELGTNYAVVGGMGLFLHGFRRYTENINILLSREDLPGVHQALVGSGYRFSQARFSQVSSQHIHDIENGVYIKFMISDDVPDPQSRAAEQNDVWLLNLAPMIELKLLSGRMRIGRRKDTADVVEVIKMLHLPQDFKEQLSPRVQEQYEELWQGVQPDPNSLWNEDKWPDETRQG